MAASAHIREHFTWERTVDAVERRLLVLVEETSESATVEPGASTDGKSDRRCAVAAAERHYEAERNGPRVSVAFAALSAPRAEPRPGRV